MLGDGDARLATVGDDVSTSGRRSRSGLSTSLGVGFLVVHVEVLEVLRSVLLKEVVDGLLPGLPVNGKKEKEKKVSVVA